MNIQKIEQRLKKVFPRCWVDTWQVTEGLYYIGVQDYRSGPITVEHSAWTFASTPEQAAEFERTCLEVFGGR